MRTFSHQQLSVHVFDDVGEMAISAAQHVAYKIDEMIHQEDEVGVFFSGAESQKEFHRQLAVTPGIPWDRVSAFAVDEFLDAQIDASCSIASEPTRELFSKVALKSVHSIEFAASDPERERSRYEQLIRSYRPKIACLGIGVSGHIAFNEPGQTYLDDPLGVRIITVSDESKAQLLQDPNFSHLRFIPDRALTVTAVELLRCPVVLVIVPFAIKARIVQRFFEADVDPAFPATLLKRKQGAQLFLDRESFSLCKEEGYGRDAGS
jgi:glucosamine-6-phosphate deaminase